jgi:hypothetical protein
MARRRFACVVAAALVVLSAGGALRPALATEPVPGTRIGTDLNEIVMSLAESGYVTLRYLNKEGRIEIVASKDDKRIFLLIDEATGVVVTAVPEGGEPMIKEPGATRGQESTTQPAGRGHLSGLRDETCKDMAG